MFSALCLTASIAILCCVIRYRVHVHVSYSPRPTRRRPTGKKQTAPDPATETLQLLTDSLIGLGADRKTARAAALRAMAAGKTQPFDELLKRAINEATAA